MFKYITLILSLSLCLFAASKNITQKQIDNSKIDGFREMKLGSSLSMLKNKKDVDSDANTNCYQKKEESLIYNKIKLKKIVYCYYNNNLFSIELLVDNEKAKDDLKTHFEKKYQQFNVDEVNKKEIITQFNKNNELENAIILLNRNENIFSFFIIDYKSSKGIY